MRETSLQRKIINFCDENNIYWVKIWGGGYQSAGIPDLILCIEGYFVGCETKVSKNKLSKLQEKNIELIIRAKGIAKEVRSMDDFMEIYKKIMTQTI